MREEWGLSIGAAAVELNQIRGLIDRRWSCRRHLRSVEVSPRHNTDSTHAPVTAVI
jgi:hypothetical protein